MNSGGVWQCGAAGLLLLAMLSPQPTAAEPQRPKVLAFVAGIERYANAELDKLIYAADDARDVFAQLGTVADLDPASKLLLADDSSGGAISDGELRNELLRFARKLKNDSNVVVYLGGHGTLSPTKKLWYLPSNYDPAEQLNFVPFSDILTSFDDQVKAKSLSGVTVTFLINVCGAGNAAAIADPNVRAQAVNDNQELIAEAQKLYRELQFGTMHMSIIPATPRDRNAFEDDKLGRSRFAHHLLEGMKGTAARADGALTAGDLFTYVEKGLGEELPKNPDFKNDILIGRTNRLEGEAHYLLGASLVAAARAFKQIVRTIRTATGTDLGAHTLLLYDLARDQLAQVESRQPELGARAQLRIAQALLGAGEVANGQDLRRIASSTHLLENEQAEIRALLSHGSDTPPFPNLKSFRAHLDAVKRLYIVIFRDDPRNGIWKSMLENMKLTNASFTKIAAFNVSWTQNLTGEIDLPAAFFERLADWRSIEESSAAFAGTSSLLVVYSGKARAIPEDGAAHGDTCFQSEATSRCRLQPLGHDTVSRIREVWGAPFTFIHAAPFGGLLMGRTPQDVSLFLAASEPTGMTYSGTEPSESSSALMAQALREGYEDPAKYPPIVQFRATLAARYPIGYVLGTPAWVPGVNASQDIADRQLEPLDRFVLHAVANCIKTALQHCDTVTDSDVADANNSLQQLEAVAANDLEGKHADAVDGYGTIINALTISLKLARDGDITAEEPGVDGARNALVLLSDLIESRMQGLSERKQQEVPLIIIVPVAVEDYAFALVPKVPHAADDVIGYAKAIKNAITIRGTAAMIEPNVSVKPLTTPRDAADLIQMLRRERAELNDHPYGMLVLVYSGRGIELKGRRYLATAAVRGDTAFGAKETASSVGQDGELINWSAEGLVDLWEIAQAVQGRWFLGIYDAQFVRPTADGLRVDQLLDKHLDSVRPVLRELSLLQEDRRPVAATRGDLPPRQVHVWLEGRLTQHPGTPHPCVATRVPEPPSVASPLAAAVVAILTAGQSRTYRELLNLLDRDDCLRADGEARTLVSQGDLDVPILSSIEGTEFVDYFAKGTARRDVNLRAALAVAMDVAARFPSARNQLAKAALMVSLALLHDEDAVLHGFAEERRGWLSTSVDLLSSLRLADFEGAATDLWPLRLELLSRAHVLQGEVELAAQVLRDARPARMLTQRGLAQKVVELAGTSLQRHWGIVLRRVGETLTLLENEGSDQTEARAALEVLIRAERARRAEPYRITQPD